MNFWQAIIYGLIQGLTEFLPVSSSAHLVLLPWFFGWPDPGLAFDVALHWGTLVGVVLYYRGDIKELLAGGVGFIGGKRENRHQFPWKIAVATVPAALAGFIFEDAAETVFRSPWVIATTLAVLAIVLFFADRKNSGSAAELI